MPHRHVMQAMLGRGPAPSRRALQNLIGAIGVESRTGAPTSRSGGNVRRFPFGAQSGSQRTPHADFPHGALQRDFHSKPSDDARTNGHGPRSPAASRAPSVPTRKWPEDRRSGGSPARRTASRNANSRTAISRSQRFAAPRRGNSRATTLWRACSNPRTGLSQPPQSPRATPHVHQTRHVTSRSRAAWSRTVVPTTRSWRHCEPSGTTVQRNTPGISPGRSKRHENTWARG